MRTCVYFGYMEQAKALDLLLRQIKDIQAQADKILKGEDSPEAIETFSKYSSELKNYIGQHVQSQEVKAYLKDLPEINYARVNISIWQYLLLPYWAIALYNDYQARNRTKEEISLVRGKYGTLELLVRGLTN